MRKWLISRQNLDFEWKIWLLEWKSQFFIQISLTVYEFFWLKIHKNCAKCMNFYSKFSFFIRNSPKIFKIVKMLHFWPKIFRLDRKTFYITRSLRDYLSCNGWSGRWEISFSNWTQILQIGCNLTKSLFEKRCFWYPTRIFEITLFFYGPTQGSADRLVRFFSATKNTFLCDKEW